MFDMKLFVDTDADSRLAKRVLKDVEELGRGLDQVCDDMTCVVWTRIVNSYEFWNTTELLFVGQMWTTSYAQEDHYYCACAN